MLVETGARAGRQLTGGVIREELGEFAAYLFFIWRLVGRDPKAGLIFPRYEPPPGVGAGGVRYLDRMGYDNRCFAAALLDLGAKGLVRIRHAGERYDIERTAKPTDLGDSDQGIVSGLFHVEKERISFGREYNATVQSVRDGYRDSLKHHYEGKLFSRNIGAQTIGWVIGATTLGVAWLLEATALVLGIFAAVILALLVLFYFLLPTYSIQGRKLQDAIEGLRQYLGVAEKDDLARMKAPPQTPQEFARFLPYAVALGVEKTWAERFAAVLGVAAVAAAVQHYYDSGNTASPDDFSSFGDSISSLDSSIASASTAPGSSSGGDGGGSSGGGGGGGGGSGW